MDDLKQMVKIPYTISGYYEYETEIPLGALIDAMKTGGESSLDSLLDEAINEDVQRKNYYGFDLDKIIQSVKEETGVDLNSYEVE